MHCIHVNTLDNEGFRLLFNDVSCEDDHIHSGSKENCRDLCADDEKGKYYAIWKDDGYNFCETYTSCTKQKPDNNTNCSVPPRNVCPIKTFVRKGTFLNDLVNVVLLFDIILL